MTNDREHDVGRSHHRRPDLAPAIDELLERYRDAMRAELEETLEELRPAREQLGFDGSAERLKPKLEVRRVLWELAHRLARELASSPEPADPGPPAPVPRVDPKRGAPRLRAADRR
jgi:hypothetical protein